MCHRNRYRSQNCIPQCIDLNLHRNNLLGPSIFPPPSMKINSAISHRKFGKDKEKNIEAKPQMLCKMHIFTQWGQTVPKVAFRFL